MINQIYLEVVEYLKNGDYLKNDFLIAGGLTTVLYSILSYIKPLPSFIYNRIKRLFLYKVTVEQSDELYTLLSWWLAENYPVKMRSVEAYLVENFGDDYSNDDYDSDNIKYRHFSDFFLCRIGFNIVRIEKSRQKLENASTFRRAYLGKITLQGFLAKKQISYILEEALKLRPVTDDGKIKMMKFEYGSWHHDYVYTNKTVDNIFFPNKSIILDKIDKFQKSEELYEKRGIEWYLGCLFKGPPGSGKSSFSRALAHYTKRDIYILNIASISDSFFQQAFNAIGKNAILILDDIDAAVPVRDNKENTNVSLPTLLNCLDGSLSRSDIIVIMTTNCPEKLDPALKRKGRVDIEEEISYPDKKSVIDFLENYYETKININLINNDTFNKSMVDIQAICLDSDDIDIAISKINKL
jgi:hypothetical protein